METVSNTVQAIRNEAERNEVFGAICYDFAQRVRTRETITVRGLQARMEKRGVVFKKEEYQQALDFLASLKLGEIVRNRKGQIAALDNISVTLQSIGKASALRTVDLEKFKPQRKFKELPATAPMIHTIKLKPQYQKVYNAMLVIEHDGETINLPGPTKLSSADLGEFLVNFNLLFRKVNT